MKKDRDSSQAPQVEEPAEPKPKKNLKGKTSTIEKSWGRGRPAGSKTKPKSPSLDNNISRDNNSILSPEVIGSKDEIDIKKQLTLKELKFLELYLTGDYTIEKAMESAGYTGYNKKYLYRLGRKIVEKYEARTGDHRKIMREMGYGEFKILQLLLNSATKAKSETVKLNARIALAKCIGLHKEVVDGVEGITIVFSAPAKTPDDPTGPGQAPPAAPPASGPTIKMIK